MPPGPGMEARSLLRIGEASLRRLSAAASGAGEKQISLHIEAKGWTQKPKPADSEHWAF